MIKTILMGSVAALALACNSESAKTEPTKDSTGNSMTTTTDPGDGLTDAEKGDGWVSLFNGKDLAGWHKYGGGAAGKAWVVDNNTIHLDDSKREGSGGGDLTTDQEFENFDLKLDWKIDTGGNSGIIFYVHEDSAKYPASYQTGPEMQVLDNQRHGDAKINKHRAGDLYDLIASSSEPVKGDLEWNSAEIKSLNGKLDLYLNGVNVVSTTMWDDNWKKLIAGSKFKGWESFGTYKKGRFSLQDHGNGVWFRNIRIKTL